MKTLEEFWKEWRDDVLEDKLSPEMIEIAKGAFFGGAMAMLARASELQPGDTLPSRYITESYGEISAYTVVLARRIADDKFRDQLETI